MFIPVQSVLLITAYTVFQTLYTFLLKNIVELDDSLMFPDLPTVAYLFLHAAEA